MKITIATQKKIGKDFVQISFSEKIPGNRFLVENSVETLEIKIPEKKEMNRRKWIIFVRGIVQELKKNKIKKASIIWEELINFEKIGHDLTQIFAENVLMAEYEFRTYKKEPKEGWNNIAEINIICDSKKKKEIEAGIKKGIIIGQSVNLSRNLANIPGVDMTPEILVGDIRKAIKNTKISMQVLDEKQIKTQKMGGVLAVGGGSEYKPRFIILEYKGGKKSEKPIVLVGKGVTFDSGGIDTKPHPYALDMMMDMSGAAATVSTLIAAEKLKVRKNIVVLIPAVENMPSGTSFRPGDIVKMMDGTTVEVIHTDAEGRLILADALIYAKKYKPDIVIDVATLTGAACVALGERASALFSKDDELAKEIEKLSEETGEYVWRLPLWDEYAGEIIGTNADIANANTKGKPGYGGSITAAMFLYHFAKDFKSWMHIDIAPRMISVFDENLAKGSVGAPIRLLIKFLEK